VHLNKGGNVNGGAMMASATCSAPAAQSQSPARASRGTIESKTNFFCPGKGAGAVGVSIPLHIGRTTSVWQTTIKNIRTAALVAIVTQTRLRFPSSRKGTAHSTKKRTHARKAIKQADA